MFGSPMTRKQFDDPADDLALLFRQVLDHIGKEIVTKRFESRPLPDSGEWAAFIESLGLESDRAIPVILLAFIDVQMKELIASDLNPTVPGGPRRLLDADSMLGTFGSRVNLCQAVGWISDDTAADLHMLRKIRNKFSHEPRASFDDGSVPGWISSLAGLRVLLEEARKRSPESYVEGDGDAHWLIPINGKVRRIRRTRRLDFLLGSVMVLKKLLVELYVAPTAMRAGFRAGELLHTAEQLQPMIEFGVSLTNLAVAAMRAEARLQGVLDDSAGPAVEDV